MTEIRDDKITGMKAIGCNGCGFRGPMEKTDFDAIQSWNAIDREKKD